MAISDDNSEELEQTYMISRYQCAVWSPDLAVCILEALKGLL